MEEKKNLNENSIYNNIYNGTYELLNTIIYEDIDCCCCSCSGKKIIMNDRNKFTFVYRSGCHLAEIFFISSLIPLFGLIYEIIILNYMTMDFFIINHIDWRISNRLLFKLL